MILSALFGLILVPYISCQVSEAYFNGTSFVSLSSKISLRGRTSFSFRTCRDHGTLVSQKGALGDNLSFNITKTQQLRITWTVQGRTKFLQIGDNLVNNQWHDVDLVYHMGNLTLNVDQQQVLIASPSYNQELFHINLQNSRVLVGESFIGCMLQGPGLEFISPNIEYSNIRWSQCPIPMTKSCDGYLEDPCFGDPCQGRGVCRPSGNSYRCNCLPKYFGNHCTYATEPLCNRNNIPTCQNGATCIENEFGNNTICLCPPNFTGAKCEMFIQNIYCQENTCQNNGACNLNQTQNGFVCNCYPGFTGERCELNIDDCESSPCLNNGECIDLVAGVFCNCTGTGYEGERCEINVDECSSTLSQVCPPGSKCFDRYGGYTCQNSCVGITCPPNSHCMYKLSSSTCACDSGYSGTPPNCIPNGQCSRQQCFNGGTCVENPKGFKCMCPTGFAGLRCEKLSNCSCINGQCSSEPGCENCEGSSCLNGTCVNGSCVCPPGLTGDRCEQDIDECLHNPCNNGICQNLHGSYNCFCQPGFTGIDCNIQFNECLSNPCENNATCSDLINDYKCTCLPGFSGRHCDINIDECASRPCQHNGTCVDGINEYKCSCLPGFTGLDCQIDIDECASLPCLNHGSCLDLQNGYACNCTDTGFTGPNCNINEDDCDPNPCLNAAICKDLIKGFECHCHAGYEGINCQIDIPECLTSPCHNEALCLEKSNETLYEMDYLGLFHNHFSYDNASGFVCVCPTGFEGELCEINKDDCVENSCQHGNCVDGIDNYMCACIPGYEGKFCSEEINECEALKPCKNNAPCTDKINDYMCQCPENIGGKNCDIQLIGCLNHQCENNAPCKPLLTESGAHGYQCICPLGFKGKLCDISTTLSFQGQGYWEPIITRNSSSYQLEFWFRTTLPNGILAYGTNIYNTIGYTLALVDGKVQFYLYDSFNRTITNMSSSVQLNNAFWNYLTISIDSRNKVILNTTQTYLERPLNEDLIFINTRVGGGHFSMPNFIGCIQEIRFDKLFLLPLQGRSKNVEVGCERKEQCNANTCSNNGICEDQWIQHYCVCQRPYFGENCTYSHIPATYGYKDVVSWSTVLIPMQDAANLSNTLDASLFLKTRKSSGLLFQINSNLNSSMSPSDVYYTQITAFLQDSLLNIVLKPSQGYSFNFSTPTFLSDGEFHFLRIIRRYSELEIVTDSEKQIFTIPNLPLNAQVLYIGALPPNSRSKRAVPDFFKGIIQDFRLNENPVVFYSPPTPGSYSPFRLRAFNSPGVQEGSVSESNCTLNNPCKNGGICDDESIINDYKCNCLADYKGKFCEEIQPCTLNPCLSGTECRNLEDGSHECLSTISLHNNQLKYFVRQDLPVNNITLKFRTIDNGSLLETSLFSLVLENKDIRLKTNHRQILLKRELFEEDQEVIITFGEKSLTLGMANSNLSEEMESIFDFQLPANSTIVIGNSNLRICLNDIKINNLILPFFKESNNTLGRDFLDFINYEQPHIGCKMCWDEDCQGNAVCEDANNSHQCLCPPYLFGRFCENQVCFSDRQPCENNGECYVLDEEIKCKCAKGFIGPRCQEEHPFCLYTECQNGATCNNFTKKCLCSELFTGEFCEHYNFANCNDGYCLNNATCEEEDRNYICQCPRRFQGRFCEKRVLCSEDDNLCNEGTCDDLLGGFICTCNDGFYGEDCNIPSPCDANSCSQQGNCTVHFQGDIYIHKCECFDGYIGENCEKDNAFLWLICIPIVVLILIGLLISSAMFVRTAKKKRATRGTYSPSRQEMYGSRVEMNHVMKPPPEERLI